MVLRRLTFRYWTQQFPSAPPPITAYHGSPHSFDQFDMSKIGTGEGAQAYGHGLYFAENEGVAGAYKKNLAPASADIAPSRKGDGWQVTTRDGGSFDRQFFPTKEEAEAHAAKFNSGHLYQVGINADPEHFLDWDKPLSEQHPQVQQARNNLGYVRGNTPSLTSGEFNSTYKEPLSQAAKGTSWEQAFNALPEHALSSVLAGGPASDDFVSLVRKDSPQAADKLSDMIKSYYQPTGEDIWHAANNQYGDPQAASNALRDSGIPGIKYLDQGSRASGDGSHNYVVFNQDLVNILKKYGIAGGAGAAGAGALMNQPQPAQAGQFPQAPPY